jgi:hypothetical protein
MGDEECIQNLIGKPETKQATCKIYVQLGDQELATARNARRNS